jgi:hypothetical protein
MKCAGAYLWININDYLDTLSLSEEVASEDKHDAMRTATEVMMASLCAKMSETSRPSTITVGRGKKSHFDEHKQDTYFFRCVGSFGA